MRLTKRQLKRIIREEYTRLKRRGLIRESRYGILDEEQVGDMMVGCLDAYSEAIGDFDIQCSPPHTLLQCVRYADALYDAGYDDAQISAFTNLPHELHIETIGYIQDEMC